MEVFLMDDKKWFLLHQGTVKGPFDMDILKSEASTDKSILIWGRGQSEWLPYEKWSRWHIEFSESQKKGAKKQTERLWKIKISGQDTGNNYTQDQMIDFLKSRNDLNEIRIWTEGYAEWKDIFQIHKLMDELGVSRRAHPRVPIMGTLTCEGASGSFTTRVLSISEGGLGITEAHHVKIGEKFKSILKSPNLTSPIHSSIEVVYVGSDGYAGVKFIGLHSESKSSIIDYVKKFTAAKK